MSYGRIKEVEPQLEAEVKELLRKAEAVDRAEDEGHGVNRRSDELPEELQRRENRLTKIREAKARLEERAKTRVEERKQEKGASADEVEAAGRAAKPKDKEQSNFTDPDSRVMETKNGWTQGDNAQVMVDESSGVIVAEEVGNRCTDSTRLVPMLAKTEAKLAGSISPACVFADATPFTRYFRVRGDLVLTELRGQVNQARVDKSNNPS